MTDKYPSIFNDVIGPVMRGPSSSHCAASVRLGRLARDLMGGTINNVMVTFDPNGSLATTHESQGSDMGLFSGLLGRDAEDEGLMDYLQAVKASGMTIDLQIERFPAPHPNTYKLNLSNDTETYELIGLSVGGGMIEIIEIDGIPVSIAGDYYETLIFHDNPQELELLHQYLSNLDSKDINAVSLCSPDRSSGATLLEVKGQAFLKGNLLKEFQARHSVSIHPGRIKHLHPVLPVLSHKNMKVPFLTCKDMLAYNEEKNLSLWQLAATYESARGNLTPEEVVGRMVRIVSIMKQTIDDGIKGKNAHYPNRILGYQSGAYNRNMSTDKLLDIGVLNRVTLYTTAMMEQKSAMGLIVAAPTAGSCGTLPGACVGVGESLGVSDEEIAKSLLVAGLIGVFIAHRSTFAAEVCGCQAECGAASGMAAAALVHFAHGTVEQGVSAVSMAMQNILGMVCDPVANRVEVPCLGKNVMAAANAVTCANMALAGFDAVVPLDEVIDTMDQVGKSIPFPLRCTGLGGLSVTETSKRLEAKLSQPPGT